MSLQTQSKFRLLVVRLGSMGDILHALPAVTALRRVHPEWVIDWVIEPRWRALLAVETGQMQMPEINPLERPKTRPIINKIHFASTKNWRKSPFSADTWREIRSLRNSLRAEHYDAVIDLQGAIRSAVVARMAGCRRMIGEARPREQAASWLFTERVKTHASHVIEQDAELVSTLAGDDLKPVQPLLPIDPIAERWVDQILSACANKPTVLINPGAGWGAKRWPVERYAKVAQRLTDRGLQVVVNAGPGEQALAASIVQSTRAVLPLACNLEQLIALTRRIALAIAGDTGPLHLACALGRPVIGIYGPTDPSRNGPYGGRFKVLRSPESRRDHSRHAEPEAGLMTITWEDVLQAADELLAMSDLIK